MHCPRGGDEQRTPVLCFVVSRFPSWHNRLVPAVLIFDVNETLLDLTGLDPVFTRVFGSAQARSRWFALALRNAITLTMLGEYREFDAIGRASLQMLAGAEGITLQPEDISAVARAMGTLPPHPDAAPALDALAAAGFRMAALTNSPPDAAIAKLEHAGLAGQFEQILSVHQSGTLKPSPLVYRDATRHLGTMPAAAMMVAAHDWDVAGAMAAGLKGALVLRGGGTVNPLFPRPDIVAPGLDALAVAIIRNTTAPG